MGDAQSYVERPPMRSTRYLTCTWVQRIPPEAAPYVHRTIPNGSVELSCEIGGMPEVVGPRTGHVVAGLAPGTTVVGVRFRPGAAGVLGVPVAELVDRTVPLDALWGDEVAVQLGETVDLATSPGDAVAALESAVVGREGGGDEADALVADLLDRLHPERTPAIAEITAELWISERQLRRRCVTATGLAPRSLHGILRFQRFLALVHASGHEPPQLSRLAAEAGYADQPHLTRESARLSGLTPRAFVADLHRQCGPSHNHAASYARLLGQAAG